MTTPLAIRIGIWTWLIAALLAGGLGLLRQLPPPAIQGLLLGLTAALVLVYRFSPPFRSWAGAIPLPLVVLFHVTRFVGFDFLWLYHRGLLPYAFAVPGGIGDIIVAALALVVTLAPLAPAARYRAFAIWNVIGLVDILLVVISAARLGLTDPSSIRALAVLPLSLLPTFLVPLIIASHFLIFARLRRERQG